MVQRFGVPSEILVGVWAQESAFGQVQGDYDVIRSLATLAYDATALAAVLARVEGGPDFSAAAITVPSGFWGRDGIFRFLPEGVAQRGLAVMKVGRHGAEVISRAPESFQAKIN